MRLLFLGAMLALSGCAYDQTAALDRCVHTPGCTTTVPQSNYGPPHQVAIQPTGADLPRR